jgi:AcrR family transcriptional regulator
MTAVTLRDQHARVTKDRILAAVADLLEQAQPEDLTVPDVAAASGISLRTIYRYFPTRDELFEGAGRWIGEQLLESPYPQNLDEVAELFRQVGPRFDERPGLTRAMASSGIGRRVRAARREERIAAIRAALRSEVGSLPEEELRRAEALLCYLHNFLAYPAMHDENGLSGEEVGDACAWAIRVLVDDLRREHTKSGGTK